MQLESVRKKEEMDKQKPSPVQEVVFWHKHICTSEFHAEVCFVHIIIIQEQITAIDSQGHETVLLQAFSYVST